MNNRKRDDEELFKHENLKNISQYCRKNSFKFFKVFKYLDKLAPAYL